MLLLMIIKPVMLIKLINLVLLLMVLMLIFDGADADAKTHIGAHPPPLDVLTSFLA